MKRAVSLCLLLFLCLTVEQAAFGQSNAETKSKQACPFSIIGFWRSESVTEMSRIFFDFSPKGYIVLMGYSPNTLPQDFEMMDSVYYKLDKSAGPKRIEFIAPRGNDAFVPGITLLDVIEYSDTSFTTLDPVTGQQTRWVREQVRRYFLTFAARSGGGPALAMLTVMDGRDTKIDALGLQLTKSDESKTTPVFGPIPEELYSQIKEESEKEKEKKANKEETVIMRFELTQAEFEATYETYQSWDKDIKERTLRNSDPYQNGMEFLRKVAEGLNQCGKKAQLHRPSQREQEEIVSKYDPPRRMLEYIRILRKKNDDLHIDDVEFPWQWRPTIQAPGQ